MDSTNVEHNLLFALMALKMGLIDNESMVAALNDWSAGRDRSVGHLLVGRQAVNEARLFLVKQTCTELLDAHHGDSHQAMLSLRLPAGLVETNLPRIESADLRAALAGLEGTQNGSGSIAAVDPLKTEFDPALAASGSPTRPPRSDRHVSAASGPGPGQPTVDRSAATVAATGEWPTGPATEPGGAPTLRPGNGTEPGSVRPSSDLFAEPPAAGAGGTVSFRTAGGLEPTVDLPVTQPIAGDAVPATVDVGGLSQGASIAAERAQGAAAPAPVRYRSLRPHAKGGLGEVFVALDEELGREVALKEIQGRHVNHPESRARFLIEAEVTGGLEHPGIVPVYGLGKYPDGRPYYAMRFIRGRTLKEAIDDFHDSQDRGQDPGERTLELRALLNRLIDVCNAMAYAHTRGILHRDIKPANIMLGGFGETLVVDWGLAKPLDQPETKSEPGLGPLRPLSAGSSGTGTMYGSTVGTPNFMSPEQAAGEHDRLGPVSDVYSLGATLYCILAGRPPFHEPQIGLVLSKVRQGKFPRPREVNRQVPPALEAICLTAMALRPDDRYPTARALADDLEHWLADEPVSVYREPWTARLARWARRHKTLVASAAALVLTALVALSIGTVLIHREQARTEANFRLARDSVDEMLSRLGEVELADVPQMEPVRRTMLRKALEFYQTFLEMRGGDRSIRHHTGRANLRVGDIEEMLGDYAAAEAAYDRAIGLLAARERPGDAGVRRDLAIAHHNRGVLLKKSNRFTEAENALKEADRLRKELVAADPDDPDAERDERDTVYQLGTVLARLGRVDEVKAAYDAAVDTERKLAAAHPDRPDYPRKLGRYLNNRGILLRTNRADRRPAEASFRQALELQQPLADRSPTVAGLQWERARTTSNLAGTLLETQGAAQAIPVYRDALARLKQLADDFPSVPDYQNELAMASFNLGMALSLEASRHETDPAAPRPLITEAKARLDDAVAIYRRLIQPEQFPHRPDFRQRLAQAENRRAVLLNRSGSAQDADARFRDAVGVLEGLVEQFPQVPEYRSDLGAALQYLATNQLSLNQHSEAVRLLERSITEQRVALHSSPANPDFRTFLLEAYRVLNTALCERKESGDHAQLAEAADALDRLLPGEATAAFRSALMLDASAVMAASDPTVGEAARKHLLETRTDLALERLKQAIKDGARVGPGALDRPNFSAIRARHPETLEMLRKTLEARAQPKVG
jgi:serine/threonine-protein kinase